MLNDELFIGQWSSSRRF